MFPPAATWTRAVGLRGLAFIISAIYILFLYLYSISLLISISYLLISNLFLLSSISRNIGHSFLKRLGGNKIYN